MASAEYHLINIQWQNCGILQQNCEINQLVTSINLPRQIKIAKWASKKQLGKCYFWRQAIFSFQYTTEASKKWVNNTAWTVCFRCKKSMTTLSMKIRKIRKVRQPYSTKWKWYGWRKTRKTKPETRKCMKYNRKSFRKREAWQSINVSKRSWKISLEGFHSMNSSKRN